jgi:serralysin
MSAPGVGLKPLSGDRIIDALTNGTYWSLDSTRTLTWALADFGAYYWVSPTATAATGVTAFATFSRYANIRFQYTGHYSDPALTGADIAVSIDGSELMFSSSSIWAKGYFPNYVLTQASLRPELQSLYQTAPGDIWLNLNSGLNYASSYAPGSQAFAVILHEIGHVLGLKHPHDDGGTGRPTFDKAGFGNLDIDVATIMSYNEENPWVELSWHPATPMILDVIALQYLYGPNFTTNSGNTKHTMSATGQFQTIYDPSGFDEIDASASQYGWNIAIGVEPAADGAIFPIGIAFPNDGIPTATTLNWLYGDFEAVQGSRYADEITGSAANNQIMGNGGNDTLQGGDGNDTFFYLSGRDAVYGGDGVDTLNVGLVASDCTLARLRANSFILRDKSGNSALCRDVESLVFTSGEFTPATMTNYGNTDLELVQIYVAAFRRTPELSGYKYWLQQKSEQGLTAVANTIFSLDVVKAIYPANSTNSLFVTAIYQNVFNKAPDAEGLLYWSGQLATRTRGQLVIDMTNVALAVADGTSGKEFFQNRIDWALYAVDYQTNSNKELSTAYLSSLTNSVTEDTEGMITLIGQAQSGLIF